MTRPPSFRIRLLYTVLYCSNKQLQIERKTGRGRKARGFCFSVLVTSQSHTRTNDSSGESSRALTVVQQDMVGERFTYTVQSAARSYIRIHASYTLTYVHGSSRLFKGPLSLSLSLFFFLYHVRLLYSSFLPIYVGTVVLHSSQLSTYYFIYTHAEWSAMFIFCNVTTYVPLIDFYLFFLDRLQNSRVLR